MDADHAVLPDAELVATLPGFKEFFVDTDSGAFHVVRGGKGPALYLLPGWPLTWWEYHRVMPALALRHSVVVMDLRGMNASDRPGGGYDKKTMAGDVARVMNALGHDSAHVVGSDIGAMVAYALAASTPERVDTLTLIDTPHPFPGLLSIPLLMPPGHPGLHPWWFAFNGVAGLPEQLLSGRFHLMQAWLFEHLSEAGPSVVQGDRDVFCSAYRDDAAVRASLEWFRAFPRDIGDFATYAPLQMPVLGLGGRAGPFLKAFLDVVAPTHRMLDAPTPGHWLALEEPAFVEAALAGHLGR